MNSKTEDILGKLAMTGIFSYMTAKQVISVLGLLAHPFSFDTWLLVFLARLFGLVFLLLVLYLTLTRLPPKDSAAGLEPRISAIAGTFITMLLIILPSAQVPPTAQLVATVLIVVGTLASVIALYWLGRSFSIMASARDLVQHGPYAIVRHPLYLAEAITVIGVVIANWSLAAVIVVAIQFAFQFRRMYNEEQILRKTFPEYDAYARRVPMVIPFLK